VVSASDVSRALHWQLDGEDHANAACASRDGGEMRVCRTWIGIAGARAAGEEEDA
jgi:hypothetical protein